MTNEIPRDCSTFSREDVTKEEETNDYKKDKDGYLDSTRTKIWEEQSILGEFKAPENWFQIGFSLIQDYRRNLMLKTHKI